MWLDRGIVRFEGPADEVVVGLHGRGAHRGDRARPRSKTCDARDVRSARGGCAGRSYVVSKRIALRAHARRRAAGRRVQHGQDRAAPRSPARCRTRPATACSRCSASSRSGSRRPSSATAPTASTRPRPAPSVPGRAAPLGVGVPAARTRRAPAAPWTVDHDRAGADRPGGLGVLPRQRPARRCSATTPSVDALAETLRRRAAGSARRCAGSTGSSRPRSASTCSPTPFDPALGHGVIETPSARVLLLRQENLAAAPDGARPVPRPARRRCRSPPATRRPRRSTPTATASSSPRSGCRPRCSTRPTAPVTPGTSMPIVSSTGSGGAGRRGPERSQCGPTVWRDLDGRGSGTCRRWLRCAAEEGAGMDDSDKGAAGGAEAAAGPQAQMPIGGMVRDPAGGQDQPVADAVPPGAHVGRGHHRRPGRDRRAPPAERRRRARPAVLEGPLRLPRRRSSRSSSCGRRSTSCSPAPSRCR